MSTVEVARYLHRRGRDRGAIRGKGDTVADDAKVLDHDEVMGFLVRVVADNAAAGAGLSTALGGRLGLYVAMAGAGPLTPEALAAKTGLASRYVREWLDLQVASEYVRYDPATGHYELPDEHAAVLADPTSPAYA